MILPTAVRDGVMSGMVVPCLVLTVLTPPATAETIRVPRDKPSIQEAIDTAAPFDTVLVAAGEYDAGLVIPAEKRGLVLTSERGASDTILNGRSGSRLLTFDEVDTLTEVSGFTFRGGDPQFDGGAIYAFRSQILVANCEFSGNNSQGDGGAIALYESWAVLWRNILSANTARRGGAIFVSSSTVTLAGNTFRNNRAREDGGALLLFSSAPTLDGNTFQGNRADDGGGAVSFVSAQGQFRNNNFARNTAKRGGGLLCEGGYQPDLRSNRFLDNVPDDVAGCSSPVIQN